MEASEKYAALKERISELVLSEKLDEDPEGHVVTEAFKQGQRATAEALWSYAQRLDAKD